MTIKTAPRGARFIFEIWSPKRRKAVAVSTGDGWTSEAEACSEGNDVAALLAAPLVKIATERLRETMGRQFGYDREALDSANRSLQESVRVQSADLRDLRFQRNVGVVLAVAGPVVISALLWSVGLL